ncbi:Dcp2, box A domain-containing protein [Paraphysoderma sedebokerense]|nr:Dcp2, box A domain-containing protein [Paraphysoderma sedebokerense]
MTFADASLDDVLTDLSSRFIINVPEEELSSVERICFQIEQAHWFYEDFIREENPTLPSFSLRNFCAKFFQHCPLLHQWSHEHEKIFNDFMQYKIRVPVCGALILNENMDKILLVKGWSAKSGWSFPKGKINKNEPELKCAVREVCEETGFDITHHLITTNHPPMRNKDTLEPDYIELTLREQRVRLYLAVGVSEETGFMTMTRKEISQIAWHFINELPGYKKKSAMATSKHKYYMVMPFMNKLRAWISARRKHLRKQQGLQIESESEGYVSQYDSDYPAASQKRKTKSSLSEEKTVEQTLSLKAALGISNHTHQPPNTITSFPHQPPYATVSQPALSTSAESIKSLLGIGISPAGSERTGVTHTESSLASSAPDISAKANHIKSLLGMKKEEDSAAEMPAVDQNMNIKQLLGIGTTNRVAPESTQPSGRQEPSTHKEKLLDLLNAAKNPSKQQPSRTLDQSSSTTSLDSTERSRKISHTESLLSLLTSSAPSSSTSLNNSFTTPPPLPQTTASSSSLSASSTNAHASELLKTILRGSANQSANTQRNTVSSRVESAESIGQRPSQSTRSGEVQMEGFRNFKFDVKEIMDCFV